MASEQPLNQRKMSDREEGIVDEILRTFTMAQLRRYVFGSHWEEVAELIDPNFSAIRFNSAIITGQAKRKRIARLTPPACLRSRASLQSVIAS